MKELDRNKEYITSNLSEERRKALLEYLKEEDEEWGVLGIDELLDCVLKCRKDGWHAFYEKLASQDAIDANTLFEEIKLDKNVSYYLGDLSEEQLEEVRLEVIKENHAAVFDSPYMVNDVAYLEWMTISSGIWVRIKIPKNKVVNALTLFDISDKTEENDLNNGQLPEKWCLKITEENKEQVKKWIESHEDYRAQGDIKGFVLSDSFWDFSYQSWADIRPEGFEEITLEQFLQFVYTPWVEKETVVSEKLDDVRELLEEKQTSVEEFNKGTSFGEEIKTEKQQFFYYNSKKHGPNFYTKEEVQFHNGEEWSEDIVVYTQLGSNKKFATTKERFKKFKEVWI